MTKQEDVEIQRLRNRVKELEEKDEKRSKSSDPGRLFFQEIEEIKKKGKNTAGEIKYKDIHDHTPIPLWRKDGKMIGPLHPANAEETFKRFYKLGIILSVKKPTEQEIAEYKQTDEYKKLRAEKDRERTIRKQKRNNNVEKLTEAIEKLVGAKIENSIKKPEEVGV